MPEISRFFGIVIRMFFDDHAPPHFHASYGRSGAEVGIRPIQVLHSELPPRALSLVLEWTASHQAALLANWERLQAGRAARKVPPLK